MGYLPANLLAIYVAGMSMIGFTLMGIDKAKARKHAYRIPEKTLFTVAFLGGGIGSFLGMNVFHHKTKHKKFVILLPVAALLYGLLLLKLYQII